MVCAAVHPVEHTGGIESVFRELAREPGAFFSDNFARAGAGVVSAVGSRRALPIQWRRAGGLRSDPPVDWLPAGLDPFEALRRVLSLYTLPAGSPNSQFADSTNYGWLGYELGSLIEPTVPAAD